MEDNRDFQIADTEESYKGDEEMQFSHQALIMQCMRGILNSGNKEMMAGYTNEKMDRVGNIIKIYIEDTRKKFISCVQTAEMFMACDYDEEASENIKEINEKLKKKYLELVKMEEKDVEMAPMILRKTRLAMGIYHREGCLHPSLQYHQEYLEEELKSHREIATELNNLTSRNDFYQDADLEA